MNERRELDLGCGRNKHPGAIGIDMNPEVNPDIVFEFKDRALLPFQDNYFDKIWMIDFVEHIQDISWLLSEVHRVGKPKAEVDIRYPHYSDKSAYSDVTHTHYLGIYSFNHYDPQNKLGKKYCYYNHFGRNFPFKIEEIRLEFSHPVVRQFSSLIAKLTGKRIYESYISSFLPINNVFQRLRILK